MKLSKNSKKLSINFEIEFLIRVTFEQLDFGCSRIDPVMALTANVF